MNEVPFMDLAERHRPLKDAIMEVVSSVIDSGSYAGGSHVDAFEKEFAAYCGTDHCVGVSSGTDALWLALLGAGVGPGDEVITVPTTFIATVEAISRTGATPVFVDVDPATCNMNAALLRQAVTQRTKAIVPVHLFGRMADMEGILAVAGELEIPVIEDAAQAHGAESGGRKAGAHGKAGCFSFYPGKNLGALGEAGAVVTDDEQLARKIRELRNHGQHGRHLHAHIGWNCRMDDIQAVVLSLKLPLLDGWNEARRSHAARYDDAFRDLPAVDVPHPAGKEHAHHLYVIRTDGRDSFVESLRCAGVGCSVHYPVPVHLQEAYSFLGHRRGDFPCAEAAAARFVSLPMSAELTSLQVDQVIAAVLSIVARSVAA